VAPNNKVAIPTMVAIKFLFLSKVSEMMISIDAAASSPKADQISRVN
jgi:hypothetical protein